MERIPVVSSNIVSIGYDPQTATLEVEFGGGAVYQYPSVPAAVFDEFMGAESKGRYFAQNIKHTFPFNKVS